MSVLFMAVGRCSRPRSALRSAVVAIASLGAWGCSPPTMEPCRDCNIVLISVDTLRADHVGAYGYPKPTTPNIDALARRGVLFENAVAQSSWTRPAHMSIFTGLHPREHGFVALRDVRRLEPDVPTIASVLGRNGWATAGFTGGVNMAASFGFDRGFDVYRNNGKYFRDNYEDMRFWLDRNQDRKFFLFYHGYDAHTPYHSDSIDRRAVGLDGPPPRRGLKRACSRKKPSPILAAYVREYDAAVRRADRYVGKLLADLERRNLLSRTIIVLLSDHGEEFLEHGRCFHVSTLYREVLQVPLLVVAPGLEPRRVESLVSASVTIAPTLMEMVGIAKDAFPGPSLVAAALGGRAPDGAVVSETERARDNGGDGHVRALTGKRFKLIDWESAGSRALYEVSVDAFERTPLHDAWRQDHLSRELARWSEQHPPRFEPRRRGKHTATKARAARSSAGDEQEEDDHGEEEEEEVDPDVRRREEQLRSLGYAE